jgi:hypothetical protein
MMAPCRHGAVLEVKVHNVVLVQVLHAICCLQCDVSTQSLVHEALRQWGAQRNTS